MGSCLTLKNEFSEETYTLTKQETLLGRGALGESRREGSPGGLLCPAARSLRVMVMGSVSGLSLASLTQGSSCLCMHCSAKMDASKKDSGRWKDM